jgi:hypothetical protein
VVAVIRIHPSWGSTVGRLLSPGGFANILAPPRGSTSSWHILDQPLCRIELLCIGLFAAKINHLFIEGRQKLFAENFFFPSPYLDMGNRSPVLGYYYSNRPCLGRTGLPITKLWKSIRFLSRYSDFWFHFQAYHHRSLHLLNKALPDFES